MRLSTIVLQSLRFHWRQQLGVVCGAAIGAAVLIGALAVGDSVRKSLLTKAAQRLGNAGGASFVISNPDRFFTQELAARLQRLRTNSTAPGLRSDRATPDFVAAQLHAGTVARQDGTARANHVQVYGVSSPGLVGKSPGQTAGNPPAPDAGPFQPGTVWLNPSLARQLSASKGDAVILRIAKPSALSRDAILTPRDDTSVALRLTVAGVVPAEEGGNLDFRASQVEPLNAFVSLDELAAAAGLPGRANLLMARGGTLAPAIPGDRGILADAELSLLPKRIRRLEATAADSSEDWIELATRRIFLEPAVVRAAMDPGPDPGPGGAGLKSPTPILTYLVNGLEARGRLAPYSMVTAADAPYTPADLKDDEVLINDWLAEDLSLKPGDTLRMTYYRADAGSRLVEYTNTFRVHSIVGRDGLHHDPGLMPDFPGLSKAESTHDWDAGFELVNKIRDQDEAYWKKYRGTPKAFIRLAAGQKLWANRFGSLTAIRWPVGPGAKRAMAVEALRDAAEQRIQSRLDPADVGLKWEPVREQALRAATSGQDFGGLFIGFSFFLIGAALLLTALLFRLGLEQRGVEIGTLLAIGWPQRRVTGLYLREGVLLAALGTVLGSYGGILYGRAVIAGLNTIWRDAVGGTGLEFHVSSGTVIGGGLASILVAALTLWLAIRSACRRPARELLHEGILEQPAGTAKRTPAWPAAATVAAALGMLAAAYAQPPAGQPPFFFGSGALLLVAGLLVMRRRLRAAGMRSRPSLAGVSFDLLALRAPARRPGRSMASAALLASATFLILSIGVHKLDAGRDAHQRQSGTGGFALWAESAQPIVQDLNSAKGQEFHGLERSQLGGVAFVALRVRNGDEASCLNLNRAQRPRLLGVDPRELARRGAFSFTGMARGLSTTNGWNILSRQSGPPRPDNEVWAVGDAASIQWALGRSLGDALEFTDERGGQFRVRIVGAVANSILQGSLIIDEAEFIRRFPGESGYRGFLIDAPAASTDAVSRTLSRAFQDLGLELTSTVDRLARFNAVQNTYLNTFQLLGGLGLILGSVGLGVIVLRNVFERRAELGLLQSVGFAASRLRRMVMIEHTVLLVSGLVLGTLAAGVAVIPTLTRPALALPWLQLGMTLLVTLANGLLWTWVATRRACRGTLVTALRGE